MKGLDEMSKRDINFSIHHIRKKLVVNLIISWFIPLILVIVLHNYSISDSYALAIAGIIPAIRTIIVLCYKRKIDWIGQLGVLGFITSFIVSFLSGGNSLPLKIYHPLITGFIGFVFIGSAIIRKPLLVKLLQIIKPNEKEYLNTLEAKKKLISATILVGVFFFIDAVIHIVMTLTLSTVAYLSMSRVVTIFMLMVLFASRLIIVRKNKK